MWRRLILVLAFWNHISSQPITDDAENARTPRQVVDFVKCCPCPGSELWDQFAAGQRLENRQEFDDASSAARVGGMDECPCRLRDADSQGAPSLFFPRAVHPDWPDVRPQDAKESKTLLQPEMGMASGVLETLREAADEGYEEALAKDAARSAAEPDERAKPIVTIILNPDSEDPLSEASTAQEARVAPPLGSNLADVKEAIPSLLRPLHQKLDSRVGASVHERVADLSKGLQLKHSNPVLSLLPGKENTDSISSTHLKNILKLNELGSKILRNAKGGGHTDVDSTNFSGLKTPLLKKLTPLSARKEAGNDDELDTSSSPNNIHEQFIEKEPLSLKSLLSGKDIALPRKPLTVGNLLNLKDVELLPHKPLKLNLPTLKLLPTNRNQKAAKETKSKTCSKDVKKAATDVQKTHHTEILDAMPSASNSHRVTISGEKNYVLEPTTEKISTSTSNDDVTSLEGESPLHSSTETSEEIVHDPVRSFNTNENGLEVTISSDGDAEIENVTVEREFIQPDHEVELSSDEVEIDHSSNDADPGSVFNSDNVEQSLANDDESVDLSNEGETIEDPMESGNQDQSEEIAAESSIEETQDMSPATSNDAFEFVSQETEGQDFSDFEFRAGKPSQEDTTMNFDGKSTELETEDKVRSPNFEFKSEELSNEDITNKRDEGLDQGSVNSDVNLRSDDSIENDNDAANTKENEEIAENKQDQNRNIVPTIKERISIKLKTTKQPKSKVLTVSKINKPGLNNAEAKQSHVSDIVPSDIQDTDGRIDKLRVTNDFSPLNNLGIIDDEDTENIREALNFDNLSASQESKEAAANDGISSSASSNEQFVNPSAVDSELVERDDNQSDEISKEWNDHESSGKSDCQCSLDGNPINNKMVMDASETREQDLSLDDSDTGASLRQDVIVQPSSLFDGGSIFDRPTLPALPTLPGLPVLPVLPALPALPALNLNTHIPTLEELNSRMSSLLPLGGLGSQVKDEEESRLDSDEDCSNAEPTMSTDASTPTFKSLLPPLKPLEDLNLDIFQVNPLGASPKIPSLNLNTFKTRLALPEHLGLKPLELHSALGNKKGGLLGASLRFGPAKIGSRNRGPDIFGSPLGNLPDLDDLRDTMRSSASNLLNSPIMSPTTSLLGDGLPTVDDLSDQLKFHSENVRAHTENTAKNVQDALASTLSEARLKTHGPPRSKFAKPQEPNLLEKMSSAHDDMSDKLRALHIDFTDRLTSLHDSILENSKLPVLTPARSSNKLSNMNPLTRTLGVSKQPSLSSNRKDSRKKPSTIVSRPSQINLKSASSKARPILENSDSIRPFKLSKAASSLQPKNFEVPKLISSSSKPPFMPIHRSDTFKLREREPPTASTRRPTLKELRKPLKKPFKPLGDIKITIATTPRPTTRHSTAPAKIGGRPVSKERESSISKPLRPTLAQRLQTSRDSKGFASEIQPSRVPAPTLGQASLDTTTPVPSLKATKGPAISKLKTTKKVPVSAVSNVPKRIAPKELTTKKGSILKPTLKSPKLATPSTLATTATTESPVLTKLREALKSRLASKPKVPEKLVSDVRNPVDQDMLRSASEDNAITIVQKDAMQENVTYKCKMMCVREP